MFMMPMHPGHRDPAQTLEEDQEAVILADRLGFYDAFVGEHITDQCENITNSFIFLATLIRDTKRIKLGTGTSNLSHAHPSLVAAHAAMFDHLAKGRFIFGISLPGNRFKVSTARTLLPDLGRGIMYKPYQKPRPEIVGTVVALHSKGVIAMGERDFHPMSANFLLAHWLPGHWANYSKGRSNVGKKADPKDWRIARTIFVADDDKAAERCAREDPASPYRFYWDKLLGNMVRSKRYVIYKRHQNEDDSAVTLERLMDELVIAGSVDRVVDEILRLRSQAGDFGEIVYASMDWVDPQLARRSMELMATEVMPRVDSELGS